MIFLCDVVSLQASPELEERLYGLESKLQALPKQVLAQKAPGMSWPSISHMAWSQLGSSPQGLHLR